jgi:hypothetical protein
LVVAKILVVAATAGGRGMGSVDARITNVAVVRVRVVEVGVERVVAVIVESVGAGEVREAAARIARAVRTAEIVGVVTVGGKG